MNIKVNGNDTIVADESSLSELICQMAIDSERVAVEWNRQVVVRSALTDTVLSEGDEIEIVQFVGGG